MVCACIYIYCCLYRERDSLYSLHILLARHGPEVDDACTSTPPCHYVVTAAALSELSELSGLSELSELSELEGSAWRLAAPF